MLLKQLFENTSPMKTAVLGWGRGMGHKGHMLLAKAVLHHAQENSAKPFFVVSRTSLVDPSTGQPWTDKPTFTKTKDDPLTPEEKLNTYRKVFPQNAEVFSVATADATKLEQVMAKIAKEGFNKVILVVGEDQKVSMGYLTRPDKSGVPPYKQSGIDELEIISRQDTTEPSSMRGSPEYQEGPRATPMRQVLLDPSKSEEEQFAVWRRDMPDNLSDEEVMDLMLKAKQRMSMVPAAKRGGKQGVAEAGFDYLTNPLHPLNPMNAINIARSAGVFGPEQSIVQAGLSIGTALGTLISVIGLTQYDKVVDNFKKLFKHPKNASLEEIVQVQKQIKELHKKTQTLKSEKGRARAHEELKAAYEVLDELKAKVKSGVAENFADGRNPQDKGDSKRHGINTKASVSSLRKTAKQGGRKGQLAHWLANMKAGRAKKK